MRPVADLPDYETPFYLFGNAPRRAARSLPQLVAAGLLSPDNAETLAGLSRRRVSLVVVAPDASCGKSSLLAGLLPCLPAEADRYFLRGSYETFQFARDPTWRPGKAVLVANEMSDFLPVYVPGHLRSRVFRYVEQGACLWTTAHASGLGELLTAWPEWPPAAPLAGVSVRGDPVVVTIELNDPARRLLAAREPGMAIDSVCHAEGGTGSGADALPVHVPASGLRPREKIREP